MQVELAVEQASGTPTIINLHELGRVLALMALAWLVLITLALLLLFLYLFIDEWQYAIRDRLRKSVVKECILFYALELYLAIFTDKYYVLVEE